MAEPFGHKGSVFVFSGILQTNWVESCLGVAEYNMRTVSTGGRASVLFYVSFYKTTSPEVLPKDALLAMVREKNGAFRLLGSDASRSIAEDTPANREIWKRKYLRGEFIPSRQTWISKDAAIALAQKALGIDQKEQDRFLIRARRDVFGWSVWVESKGGIIGGYTTVGVGDDGNIKFVSPGM